MFKGYKTVVSNFVAALPIMFDIGWAIVQSVEFGSIVPHNLLPYYSMFLIGMNVLLRAVTTTKIGKKE